jgi:hypothetical protein
MGQRARTEIQATLAQQEPLALERLAQPEQLETPAQMEA